jgi:hypothetical protein
MASENGQSCQPDHHTSEIRDEIDRDWAEWLDERSDDAFVDVRNLSLPGVASLLVRLSWVKPVSPFPVIWVESVSPQAPQYVGRASLSVASQVEHPLVTLPASRA